MPVIRGSYRRLDAPSDIFYLDVSYQIGPPVSWTVVVTGGSLEIAPMSGELEVDAESAYFVRDRIIAVVRARVELAIADKGRG